MSSFSFGFLLAIITPPEEYIFMAIYTNFVTGSDRGKKQCVKAVFIPWRSGEEEADAKHSEADKECHA
jgi:hypothetical protein